jgi:C4-dicarboxylate transporter DctQ subunit
MIGRLADVAALLAGVATLAITLLVTYDVLMRYFLNEPQLFVDEVASFLLVFVIFAGLAATFRAGVHVRVDLLTAHLPGRFRARLRLVSLALGVLVLAVSIWVTTDSTLSAWRYGRVSAVELYPLWPVMALIPAGLLLLLLAMAATFVRQLRALGAGAAADEVPPEDARA